MVRAMDVSNSASASKGSLGSRLLTLIGDITQLQNAPKAVQKALLEETAAVDAASDAFHKEQNQVIKNLKEQLDSMGPITTKLMQGKLIVVDASGCGHFKDIQPALQACREGDTISIRGGNYSDPIKVSKPGITVRGAGVAHTFLNHTDEGGACVISAKDCTISNISIKQSNRNAPCLVIKGTNSTIENCAVASSNACCVLVDGEGACIKECAITNSKQHGIHVRKRSEVQIMDSTITGHAECGVEADPGSNLWIQGCDIAKNGSSGVYLTNHCTAKVLDCTIHSNGNSNIDICSGSKAIVKRNKIHSGQKAGICFSEYCKGVAILNEIQGNVFSNIACLAGSQTDIQFNDILDSQQHGVLVTPKAHVSLKNNWIRGNSLNQLRVEHGGKIKHSDNATPWNLELAIEHLHYDDASSFDEIVFEAFETQSVVQVAMY